MFTINCLGAGSAKPSTRHNQACTVLNIRGALYMIDCGEGSQQQMQRMHLKFNRLRHIFLTHLHGDHILGLPGLLRTLSMTGHTGRVTLHTFKEGIRFIDRVRCFFGYKLGYELEYHTIEPTKGLVLDTDILTVESIPLAHRVDCVGYIFREKPKPLHLVKEMLDYHHVPIALRHRIKAGDDFRKSDGTIVPNNHLTRKPAPPVSYAHISDTSYMPQLATEVAGATCMLHESTYADDRAIQAAERGHSTARQAAILARDANVGQLILTHFSSAYHNEDVLLQQAREIFPTTRLATEGLTLELPAASPSL